MTYTLRNGTNAVTRDADGFIIGPEDSADWLVYQNWLMQGNTPSPAPPEVLPVPAVVPMWSVRTVLKNHGLFDSANNLIMNSNNIALINFWEYGNEAQRSSPSISMLATSLDLSPAAVDQMFIEAGSLLI